MKAKSDRIKKLSENLGSLLKQEKRTCQEMVSSLLESLRLLHGDTADRRLQPITDQLKRLQERFDLLVEMAERNFLEKVKREAEELKNSQADSRIGSLLTALVEIQPP